MSLTRDTKTIPIDANNDNVYSFSKSDHPSCVTSKFSVYLRQAVLCDVVFVCNYGQVKRRINAHRLIVSMLSDDFRSLFESQSQNEIILNDTDPDVFEKLILYAYEGHLIIDPINVIELLNIAHRFHVTEIIEACCSFIKNRVQPSNCFGLYRLTLAHDLQDLSKMIWKYILSNFSTIVQNSHAFLELTSDEMKRILESDDINVDSEETIYEAFISWLDYDSNRLNDHLIDLFSLIRLPLIERKYLTDNIDTNARFENNSLCQMLILEAMRYHLAPEKRSSMKSIRTKARKATLGVLYCFGGFDATTNSQIIERYDFRSQCWKIDTHWNSRRSQFACIRLDKHVYICGGRDGLKVLNSIEVYDLQTKNSILGPSMLTNRYDLGIATFCGPLYTIGGHDGRAILNTVERFDPITSEWTYVASMNYARFTLGVAVLENRIYAVGGKDSLRSLREIECFDPHTNRWSLCASMIKCRANVAVASCNVYLYAIGGYEFSAINRNEKRHDDGERYDPKCNQWTLITSFSRPKESLGIAIVDNLLYIVGGFDGNYLSEVEKYDIETNHWEKRTPLGTKRASPYLIHVPNSIYQLFNLHVLSKGSKNHSNSSYLMNRRILS